MRGSLLARPGIGQITPWCKVWRERSSEEKYGDGLGDFQAAVRLAQTAFDQRKAPIELPVMLECWNASLDREWHWVVGSVWRIECGQRLLAQV
jgi:hypothetical protein